MSDRLKFILQMILIVIAMTAFTFLCAIADIQETEKCTKYKRYGLVAGSFRRCVEMSKCTRYEQIDGILPDTKMTRCVEWTVIEDQP